MLSISKASRLPSWATDVDPRYGKSSENDAEWTVGTFTEIVHQFLGSYLRASKWCRYLHSQNFPVDIEKSTEFLYMWAKFLDQFYSIKEGKAVEPLPLVLQGFKDAGSSEAPNKPAMFGAYLREVSFEWITDAQAHIVWKSAGYYVNLICKPNGATPFRVNTKLEPKIEILPFNRNPPEMLEPEEPTDQERELRRAATLRDRRRTRDGRLLSSVVGGDNLMTHAEAAAQMAGVRLAADEIRRSLHNGPTIHGFNRFGGNARDAWD